MLSGGSMQFKLSSEGESLQGSSQSSSLLHGERASSSKGALRYLASDAVLGSGDERSTAVMFAVDILCGSDDSKARGVGKASITSHRKLPIRKSIPRLRR
jgi:hypothetical protein